MKDGGAGAPLVFGVHDLHGQLPLPDLIPAQLERLCLILGFCGKTPTGPIELNSAGKE